MSLPISDWLYCEENRFCWNSVSGSTTTSAEECMKECEATGPACTAISWNPGGGGDTVR